MTAYFVLGVTFILFALGLTALGLTRDDFPPTQGGGRALMAVAGLIAVVTFGVLLATTKREHPREEAAHKKAEELASEKAAGGGGGGEAVQVTEREYSIKLEGGDEIAPGKHTFEVTNAGEVPHDLAIVDGGADAKTPLIDGGEKVSLDADLKPGKYKFYCTVPGHEQLGMKTDVTVGG